jgi:hypothetical protein
MATSFFAQSKLFAKHGDKPRRPAVLGIGTPVRAPNGGFACRVHLRGIERACNIYGEDSMQALALGLAFLQMRLHALRDDGWLFYFGPRDRQQFDVLSGWFPRWVTRKQPNRAFESGRAQERRAPAQRERYTA